MYVLVTWLAGDGAKHMGVRAATHPLWWVPGALDRERMGLGLASASLASAGGRLCDPDGGTVVPHLQNEALDQCPSHCRGGRQIAL